VGLLNNFKNIQDQLLAIAYTKQTILLDLAVVAQANKNSKPPSPE